MYKIGEFQKYLGKFDGFEHFLLKFVLGYRYVSAIFSKERSGLVLQLKISHTFALLRWKKYRFFKFVLKNIEKIHTFWKYTLLLS